MIDFSMTTAFRLVRRLAAGQGSPAMYLLVYDEGNETQIEADLREEVEIQTSQVLSIARESELADIDQYFGLADATPIRVLRIDRWSPHLRDLLNDHIVRLERTGAQFLFLVPTALSERLLKSAPNFRNRLTEVFRIVPDDLAGGAPD